MKRICIAIYIFLVLAIAITVTHAAGRRRQYYAVKVDEGKLEGLQGGSIRPEDCIIFTRDESVLCFLFYEYDPISDVWTNFSVPETATLKFGLKSTTNRTGDFLVFSDTDKWNIPGDWNQVNYANGYMSVRVNANTTAITNLFGASDEFDDFIAEIQMTELGQTNPTTLAQWDCRIYHDIIQGSEGVPTSAAPSYATSAELANGLSGKISKTGDTLVGSFVLTGKLHFANSASGWSFYDDANETNVLVYWDADDEALRFGDDGYNDTVLANINRIISDVDGGTTHHLNLHDGTFEEGGNNDAGFVFESTTHLEIGNGSRLQLNAGSEFDGGGQKITNAYFAGDGSGLTNVSLNTESITVSIISNANDITIATDDGDELALVSDTITANGDFGVNGGLNFGDAILAETLNGGNQGITNLSRLAADTIDATIVTNTDGELILSADNVSLAGSVAIVGQINWENATPQDNLNCAGVTISNGTFDGTFVGDGSGLTGIGGGSAADWSSYIATQIVDIAGQTIINVGTIKLTNGAEIVQSETAIYIGMSGEALGSFEVEVDDEFNIGGDGILQVQTPAYYFEDVDFGTDNITNIGVVYAGYYEGDGSRLTGVGGGGSDADVFSFQSGAKLLDDEGTNLIWVSFDGSITNRVF